MLLGSNYNPMSHTINTIFAEDMRERFAELREPDARQAFLQHLNQMGRSDLADRLLAEWDNERAEYLSERGLTEKEIFIDPDSGYEFFFTVSEHGSPNDDYEVINLKECIPRYLQSEVIHA